MYYAKGFIIEKTFLNQCANDHYKVAVFVYLKYAAGIIMRMSPAMQRDDATL